MLSFLLSLIKYLPVFYAIYYRLFARGFFFELTLLSATTEILSYIILSKIWFEFFKTIENIIYDFILFFKNKSEKTKLKLKLDLTYKFPSELMNFTLVIVLSFIVYRWFTSTPIIIAASAWVFKQINQDISPLIVLSIIYVFKKPLEFSKDLYTAVCKVTPNYMPSAIYIPQKLTSSIESLWGMNQGLRSLKNNFPSLNKKDTKDIKNNSYFIYNCDTHNIDYKKNSIINFLNFYKVYGPNLFMFNRNTDAHASRFLWKPGAYMSDYQILSCDINHPLTYTSKCFDTRRQLKIKVKDNKNKSITYQADHVPLCCDLDPNKKLRSDEKYDYFIKYFPRKNSDSSSLYLKEITKLIKLNNDTEFLNEEVQQLNNGDLICLRTSKLLARKGEYRKDGYGRFCRIDTIKDDIKTINRHYIVDPNVSTKKLRVHLGSLFDENDILIAKEDQWERDSSGKMIYYIDKNLREIYKDLLPQYGIDIFSQKIELLDKTLNIDKHGNLIDNATGEIYSKTDKYIIEFYFDLYEKQGENLIFLEKKFQPDNARIKGEDFRRLPSDRLNKVDMESLNSLIKDKLFTEKEARQLSIKGILGNDYLLHKGKTGWEQEFFIKAPYFKYFKKVVGGIVAKASDGFFLDKENYLCIYKKNKQERIIPYLKAAKLNRNKENQLILSKDNDYEIIRKIDNRTPLKAKSDDEYYLVTEYFYNYTKVAKNGYVVNQKDGFYIHNEKLWYVDTLSEYEIKLIAEKDQFEKIKKCKVMADYASESKLIQREYKASLGSWYIDGEKKYRKRKYLGNIDYAYFNKNLDIIYIEPVTKKIKIYKNGNYTVNKNSIWSIEKNIEDEIIGKDNIKYFQGALVEDKILADSKEYQILNNGFVKTKDNKIYPYGLYLKNNQNEYIKDINNNPIGADVKINIINQTDSDTEFLPETIPNLNSILIRNLQENKDAYLMLQPEISFRNVGASMLSRISAWAQEMYKFIDRALFRVYKRSTAYGKMTKYIDAYNYNINFKEAIPPIARTHDHWEAMKLKTALISSNTLEKKNTLLENVPSNFLLYLKRQIGWLSGDLILLELETKFGIFLDLLRGTKQLLLRQIDEAKYWFKHASKGKHMIGYTALPSSKERLESVKRTSFNPFLFGIWILIIGFIASIFPGTLSIDTPKIAWGLFWIIMTGLILIPKFIIPIFELIKNFQHKYIKLIIILSYITLSFFIAQINLKYFPGYYENFTYIIFIGILFIFIIAKPLVCVIAGNYRRLRYRISSLLFLIFISIFCFFILPEIIYELDKIPSARWIPFLIFVLIPILTPYLIPLFSILFLTKTGRSILETTRKGLLEALYSTSLLLMMVVYITIGLYKKVKFMINNPKKSFSWTPSEIYKYNIQKPTIKDMYILLIAAPVTSIIAVVLPILTKTADYSLIFYGWPIFIWSWFLGPLLSYVTAKYGKNLHYGTIHNSAILEFFSNWVKDYKKEYQNFPEEEKIVKKIIDLTSEKDNYKALNRIKLFAYYFNNKVIEKENLNYKDLETKLQKNLKIKNLNIDRLNEYNWETFSEIEKTQLIIKVTQKKKLDNSIHIKKLQSINLLSKVIGNTRPGSMYWEDFKLKEKEKITKSILQKCKISDQKFFQLILELVK